jgi:hypothetical protein
MALLPHHNRRLKKRSSLNNNHKPSHNRNHRFTDDWKPVRPESSHHQDDQRQALTPVTTATSTETTAGDMSSQGSHHHHHFMHSNNNNNNATPQPQQRPLAAPTPLSTACSPCGFPPRLDATTTSTLVSSPTSSIPLEITIVHHCHSNSPTRIRAETCPIRREALFNDSMDAYIGDQEDEDNNEHDSESSTDLDHFMTLLDLQEPASGIVGHRRRDNGAAEEDDSLDSRLRPCHHPLLVLPQHRHQTSPHNGAAAATTSLEEIELLPCWNKFHHDALLAHHTSNTQHDAVWGLTTTTLHDNNTPLPPVPPPINTAHCDCRSDEEHSRRSWPSDEECPGPGQHLLRCHSCCRDLMCGGSVLSAKDSRIATVRPVNALD